MKESFNHNATINLFAVIETRLKYMYLSYGKNDVKSLACKPPTSSSSLDQQRFTYVCDTPYLYSC